MVDICRVRKLAGWWPAAILLLLNPGSTASAQDVDSFQQQVQAVSCQQDLPVVAYASDIPIVPLEQALPSVPMQQALPALSMQQDFMAVPYHIELPSVPLEPRGPVVAFRQPAQPVFYQQDVPPVPDSSSPPPPPSGAANPAAASAANQDKIGQAPENTSQLFLREDTILLKQGEWAIDESFSYTLDEKPFTQLAVTQPGNVITPVASELHRRLMVVDTTLRYGLTDRLQFFADLPVGWTNTETSTIGTDSNLNDGGLGDTSCGVSYLFHHGSGASCDPDIVVTAGMTAPTSHGDFLADLLVTPQAELGQGFWAAYWNVLVIQNYDPVIVFYGFGSRHAFTRELDGQQVQAGDQYSYRMGVGFAVNERVTFSSTLFGAYITEPRVNGEQIPGTSLEPVYLRLAVTLAQRCDRICEPFVECGLTDDAVNTRFGITWTF